jgi:hypothetical protein
MQATSKQYTRYCLLGLTLHRGMWRDHIPLKHGSVVSSGTTLQSGRTQVRFPMMSLNFSFYLILSVALWAWGWLSS